MVIFNNLIIYISLIFITIIIFILTKQTNINKDKRKQKNNTAQSKNRIFNIKSIKNNIKTSFFSKNNISYLKLPHFKTSIKYVKFFKQTKPTYVEILNKNLTESIYKTTKSTENILRKNKNNFRTYNNVCLIELIAQHLASNVLTKNKYNIFNDFKQISNKFKIYKKEAIVLKDLLIIKLSEIYYKLNKDIFNLKKQILKAKKVNHINKKTSLATIYGIYLFNLSSSKILLDKKELIIQSTNFILNELDEIYYKQRIIYNYISLLS